MNTKPPAVILDGAQLLPSPFLRLFHRSIVNLRTSFLWALIDMKCQYRRSKVGPLWETINVAVLVIGLAAVSSGLFGGNTWDHIGYIGLGMIIWSFISTLVLEGCGTFVKNSSHLLSSNISVDLYIGRTVFKAFIIFGHHIILYLVGVVFGFVPLGWTSLLAIPGLALLIINSFWVVTALALLCARFRDLELIIRNLLQLALLVTPVFWNYHQIAANRQIIVDGNVLFYLIQVVRLPLLGEVPSVRVYMVAIGSSLFGYLVAALIYYRLRSRLAFFV